MSDVVIMGAAETDEVGKLPTTSTLAPSLRCTRTSAGLPSTITVSSICSAIQTLSPNFTLPTMAQCRTVRSGTR